MTTAAALSRSTLGRFCQAGFHLPKKGRVSEMTWQVNWRVAVAGSSRQMTYIDGNGFEHQSLRCGSGLSTQGEGEKSTNQTGREGIG